MKTISIVTPCYNEEENVKALADRVREIFSTELTDYNYEHIFIDNCSNDRTVEILTEIANMDKKVKVIVNSRNFGHLRSPYYGLQQTTGDAAMTIAADFQDPPEMIVKFVRKWEEGYKIIAGVKASSKENPIMYNLRKFYYKVIRIIAEADLIENFIGFGLYDRQILDIIKTINDPDPYLRGLVCEIGFKKALIPYDQPKREKGNTKVNLYTLYDTAMLGITTNSKIPIRIATLLGFSLSGISLFIAIVYFIFKLVFWNQFTLGLAPMVIGLFFFSSVQLLFIGIIGEYIGAINTKVMNRPLIIEEKRINFD